MDEDVGLDGDRSDGDMHERSSDTVDDCYDLFPSQELSSPAQSAVGQPYHKSPGNHDTNQPSDYTSVGSAALTSRPNLFTCNVIYDDYLTEIQRQPYGIPLVVPLPRGRSYSTIRRNIAVSCSDSFFSGQKPDEKDAWHFVGSELPLSGPAMRMIWLLHRLMPKRMELRDSNWNPCYVSIIASSGMTLWKLLPVDCMHRPRL